MSKIIRVYLCGPMTGLPLDNVPTFNFAAEYLRGKGLVVENPAEIEPVSEDDRRQGHREAIYKRCLPPDIVRLSTCNVMIALPGWEQSRGTNWEREGADMMGIPFIAPDYTSDEFPGELTDYLDACWELLKEELCVS